MERPATRLRRSTRSEVPPEATRSSRAPGDATRSPAVEPTTAVSALADAEDDPFHLGWREHREVGPDGVERVRRVPLTYRDLLDPQEGDFVAESTIHRDVTEALAGILKYRFRDDPSVAVWRNLKIAFVIPGLTTGPGPDLCVVAGVVDRDRPRKSFRFGEEPGTIRLVVEVVSESSLKKDYEDLLEVYAPLGVEEYVAVRPSGFYSDGPFELKGWRLDGGTKRLRAFAPEDRLHLETAGVLLGTGAKGRGLFLWDAATGERLLTPDEARRTAEERAQQAEERARRAEAEIERLRAGLRNLDGT